MADHLHKQIRAALVTKLTGLTTTASRVWANRLQVLQDANLPGLRIYLDDEAAEGLLIHTPEMYDRKLSIVVEAVAKATSALDDTLDLISKEVEIALATGITVAGRTLEVFYTGMRFDDEQLDKPVGVKRMTFSLTYSAMSNTPDVLS